MSNVDWSKVEQAMLERDWLKVTNFAHKVFKKYMYE